jgi:UDP-N-acetylmuramate dehydrogenase
MDFTTALVAAFGEGRVRRGQPLAPLTTFRVGGAADWFLETRGAEETIKALDLARTHGVPVTVLGGGSNVLVSDAGVRGLVIRSRSAGIHRVGDGSVEADAGSTINGLVRWAVARGLAGLEAWAGTPGTVGGAIFGNAHFGGRNIGNLVERVRIADRTGRVIEVPAAAMAFGYDRSRLQDSGEILLSAAFSVSEGDPATLRTRARESLAYRKRTQPLDTPSAGCVFRNPERGRDQVPEGLPWSAGALVDRAGAKGWVVGGARVSPTHGNFIVNDGTATAADIRHLIEACRRVVGDRFGVDLREEIVYLGDFS